MQMLELFLADALAMGLAILFAMKLMSLISGVNVGHELTVKDNRAFGVIVAAQFLGLAFILNGVHSGEYEASFMKELFSMLSYLFSGIILMWLSRYLLDKLVLTKVDLEGLIRDGNTAAAIVMGGNIVTASIIIMSLLTAVETDSFAKDVMVMAIIWLATYLFIAWIGMLYRNALYRNSLQSGSHRTLQSTIMENKLAPAIAFAGMMVALALVTSNLSEVVMLLNTFIFDKQGLTADIALWIILACPAGLILLTVSVNIISPLLFRKNEAAKEAGVTLVYQELMVDNNIGFALTQAALYIGTAFVMRVLIGL